MILHKHKAKKQNRLKSHFSGRSVTSFISQRDLSFASLHSALHSGIAISKVSPFPKKHSWYELIMILSHYVENVGELKTTLATALRRSHCWSVCQEEQQFGCFAEALRGVQHLHTGWIEQNTDLITSGGDFELWEGLLWCFYFFFNLHSFLCFITKVQRSHRRPN